MDRRSCLKYLALAIVLNPVEMMAAVPQIAAKQRKVMPSVPVIEPLLSKNMNESAPMIVMGDKHIKDYLTKVRHPNNPHKDDIILSADEFEILRSVVRRLERVRSHVGHGNFCILGFDESLAVAVRYPDVGAFTGPELAFIEEIFCRDAKEYGFYGEKQVVTLTSSIPMDAVYKVPYTGNYLFKGDSVHKYELVHKEVGSKLILTSGIRGVVKQFYLFLSKANRYDGNMSLASRSLAPPGYSYHATGDFDVGQIGYGGGNFSENFLKTPVYHQLIQQGYVHYRYERDNMLGVRYEPWHIKL